MGAEELRQALAGFRLVFLDTMVFSYHLANHPRYAPLTTVVLAAVEQGAPAGLTTALTLAELLTVPAQAADRPAMLDYELFLTHFPNLTIVPLDIALARTAAEVRAETRSPLPDAIQVAAGRLGGVDALLTNDREWSRRVAHPQVILLEDYVD
jgi:predicted nucleic acid-binding protein